MTRGTARVSGPARCPQVRDAPGGPGGPGAVSRPPKLPRGAGGQQQPRGGPSGQRQASGPTAARPLQRPRGCPESSPQGAGRGAEPAGAVGAPAALAAVSPAPRRRASRRTRPARGVRRRGNDVIALGATLERVRVRGGRAEVLRRRQRGGHGWGFRCAGTGAPESRGRGPCADAPSVSAGAGAGGGAVDRTWRKVGARTWRPLRPACGPPGDAAPGLPEGPRSGGCRAAACAGPLAPGFLAVPPPPAMRCKVPTAGGPADLMGLLEAGWSVFP